MLLLILPLGENKHNYGHIKIVTYLVSYKSIYHFSIGIDLISEMVDHAFNAYLHYEL